MALSLDFPSLPDDFNFIPPEGGQDSAMSDFKMRAWQSSPPNPLNGGNILQPQYPVMGPANPNPNILLPPDLYASQDGSIRIA